MSLLQDNESYNRSKVDFNGAIVVSDDYDVAESTRVLNKSTESAASVHISMLDKSLKGLSIGLANETERLNNEPSRHVDLDMISNNNMTNLSGAVLHDHRCLEDDDINSEHGHVVSENGDKNTHNLTLKGLIGLHGLQG